MKCLDPPGVLCALAVALLLASTPPAQADWDLTASAGAVIRDGESAQRVRLGLSNSQRPLTHRLYVDWLRIADENSYELGYLPRYWINRQLYGFAEGRYRVDKPLGIESDSVGLAGLGYQVLDTAVQTLWLEAGVGARRTEFADVERDEPLGVIRGGYARTIVEQLRLDLTASALLGEAVDETRLEAGIAYQLAGTTIGYSYRIRRLDFDTGESVNDDESFVSLSYGFP